MNSDHNKQHFLLREISKSADGSEIELAGKIPLLGGKKLLRQVSRLVGRFKQYAQMHRLLLWQSLRSGNALTSNAQIGLTALAKMVFVQKVKMSRKKRAEA